jgi:hypothetical protein
MTKIEKEYNKLYRWYNETENKKNTDKTQKQAVLEYLEENRSKIWWFAFDVVNKTNKSGDFLSHRAPARLTDLANEGTLISEPLGKYVVYRLK